MHYVLFVVGFLHLLFMLCEIFPWSEPLLLRVASRELAAIEPLYSSQRELVATIVHNAGVYNGIVAGGLFWAAFGGPEVLPVAEVMLVGAIAAGTFGTLTLKSPVAMLQAVLGVIGLFMI